MTNTTTTGRKHPVWTMVSLAAALAVIAVLAFGGASQAQPVGAANLVISKSISPKTVTVGQQQVYTIQITNKTGSTAKQVQMTDPLPQNVQFIKASTSLQKPGSCGLNAQRTVVCNLGSLDVNQGVTIKIYVKTTKAGSYTNTARVTHSTTELDASNNRDSASHRAVEKDRDGGGKRHHHRCGVKAIAGGGGATACVGGVRASG